MGLLKSGEKNLFLSDETGKTHEIKSLCVLDFYVHESKQRSGFGKQLYDYMLNVSSPMNAFVAYQVN